MAPRRSGGSGFGSRLARADDQRARERQAVLLFQQNRLAEAEGVYRQLIAAGSRNPEVYLNLAAILWLTNRPEATIEPLHQAIALDPGNPEAHATLGTALQTIGDRAGGVAAYEESLRLQPTFLEARVSLGNALQKMGHLDEALAHYDTALSQDPGHVMAHVHRGGLLLNRGDYREGWKSFEWRWQDPAQRANQLQTRRPRWQPGAGYERLLLWAEQGVGDEILFASMLDEARTLADQILVQADPRLQPLLQRSLQGFTWCNRHQPIPESDYDAHLPIGSLGQYLRPDAGRFPEDRRSFLKADPVRSRQLRACLGGGERPVFGISWHSFSGNAANKSLPLEAMARALLQNHPERRLVSLQYGPVDETLAALEHSCGIQVERVSDLNVSHDLDGLASLIMACDRVVTVSNVTAHLAGALGADTRVLISLEGQHAGKDGRWPNQGGRTPWYPSVSLLVQQQRADWDGVLMQLATQP